MQFTRILRYFRTALEGHSEDVLTVDYIQGKLIDEYNRRIENNNTNEIALKTANKYNSYNSSTNHRIEVM